MRKLAVFFVSFFLVGSAVAKVRGIRWSPAGALLARDGAIALTLTGPSRGYGERFEASRVHLRQVRTGEVVSLETITAKDEDAKGNPVHVFYPSEELRPFTTYVFETRGPTLPISRVFRTRASYSDLLPSGAPRFRRLRGQGSRFSSPDLARAIRVEVEIEAGPSGESEDGWHEEHFTAWKTVGSFWLEPRKPKRGDFYVDLGDLLDKRDGAPCRVRFRLIGWDAFRGRPSGWRIIGD